MQDDHRKIRLPQSYLNAEEQKKQAAVAAQETYFSGDETDMDSVFLSPDAPVFLPEILDSAAPLQGMQTLHIELPLPPQAKRRGAQQASPSLYDHKADGFVPQGNSQQGQDPSVPQGTQFAPDTKAPQITRRMLPLVVDTPQGGQTDSVQGRNRFAQQDDVPARKAAQLQGTTVPAQAAYRPRHAIQSQKDVLPKHAKQGEAHVPSQAAPPPQAAPSAQEKARKKKSSCVRPKDKKAAKPRKKHWLLKKVVGVCVCLALLCSAGLAVYLNRATQNDFLWLDLAQLPHRNATILYGADGVGGWQEYTRLEATQQKIWVNLENVPENLQYTFVAIEDQNFYKHNGVSITRTLYAGLNELKYMLTGTYFGGENGMKQGASTITQQLVKNLTYDNEAGGFEGYLRKIREIYRAYKLDADYEKDEIMEAYLNVISFTGNTAGVQAESVKLFNKTVEGLSLEQCASIAAITKNPYRYDPLRNQETHLTRRNYILYEMWQQGYISEEAYNTASAQPVGLEQGEVTVAETPITSYFTDRLIEDVSNDLARAYGLARAETTNLLYNGGLRIYTTVDATLQTAMEQNMKNGTQFFPQPSIQATVTERDENGKAVLDATGKPVQTVMTQTPQAAMVSVGYDGALKAVVGGIGEKDISRGFNRGTGAVRQVGSTMKPIGAYALAVEKNKVHWSTAVMDAPVRKIEDDATGEMREWPANFSKTYANLPIFVADAIAESINTVAVRVGERAGVRNIYNFTRNQLGITSFTREDCAAGPMILGSSTYGVTPYELAGAHMMFGNGGSFTTLHSYTDVQTGYGRSILQPVLETRQVLSPDTAYVMNRMLKGVMEGTGTAAGYAARGEMESIGKTGTTSDNRDYWFVGLTPYYVTAAWYGYDSGAALHTSLGTHAPTTAWRAVMQQAQRDLPPLSFPVDESVLAEKYCTESGGIATAGCTRTRIGYYRAAYLPGRCLLHRN